MSAGTQLVFNCGDHVRERDGRHVGVVVAAFKWTVRVQWLGSNIKEDLDLSDVVLVEPRPEGQRYSAQIIRNRKRIGLPT